jgi:tetratricopeptide (TPR) repeat protein
MGAGTPAEALERATDALLRFRPEVETILDELVEEAPDWAPGLLARAWLGVLTSEPGPTRASRALVADLAPDALDARERAHRAAVLAWSEGRLRTAQAILDDWLVEEPGDLWALFAGHQLDFFLGDQVSLRDRLARSLPWVAPDDDARGFVRGMFAFGLEEAGTYDRAEAEGLAALDAHPDDVWALHAVVHAHEMRARVDEGLRLMERFGPYWEEGNAFRVHNFWHKGLYLLELGRDEDALDVYDRVIHPADSPLVALELLDASALLWRLYLDGRPETERFRALAEAWTRWQAEPFYCFNEVHAVMALVGAGRLDDARALVADLEQLASSNEPELTTARMAREVGVPVARALVAVGEGAWEEALSALWPIRTTLARFGGSHAQRDAFVRTALVAALRAGELGAARVLVAERLSLKEDSPWAWLARAQLAEREGDELSARTARQRAGELRARWAERLDRA